MKKEDERLEMCVFFVGCKASLSWRSQVLQQGLGDTMDVRAVQV